MPIEVGLALGAALDQRAGRHGEEPRSGNLAQRVGDGQQLVVAAHLAGKCAAAGAVVAHDLIGGEAERAEAQAVGDELGDAGDLVGGRLPLVRGVGPEHRRAHRHVTDERREVAQHRELIEHAEVVGLCATGEAHAVVDRRARDLLDGTQRVDDVVARGVVGDRRERVPTIAGDHGGHAERRRRRDIGVPEEVGVEVRVRVDEAGREHEVAAVDLRASGARCVAHHRDPVAVDGDVGLEPGAAAAVEHQRAPHHQVVLRVTGHLFPLSSLRDGALGPRSAASRDTRLAVAALIGPPGSTRAACRGWWRDRRRATSRRRGASRPRRGRCRRTARHRRRDTLASVRR